MPPSVPRSQPSGAAKVSAGKLLTHPAAREAAADASAMSVPSEGWTLEVDDTRGVHAQLVADQPGAAPLLELALTSGEIMHDLSGAQTVDISGTTYAVRTEWLGDHYAFAVARDIGDGTFGVIAAGHADAALVPGASHAIGFDAIQSFLASSGPSLG